MATQDLGQKFLCADCGAKFYDLGKKPPTCPACETVHVPVEPPKPRRASAAAKKPAPPPKPPKADDKVDADAAGGDEDKDVKAADSEDTAEDDVIEDTSDLGEDDDEIADVVKDGDKGE